MTTTFKVVDFHRNHTSTNNNTFGFNVCGGYSTDLPATIFSIDKNENKDLIKLDEGDILVEINGINTRHLTLNENPEYKSKFKIKKESDDFTKYFSETISSPKIISSNNDKFTYTSPSKNNLNLEISSTTSPKTFKFDYLFTHETSRSYDNHINHDNPLQASNLEHDNNVNSVVSLINCVEQNHDITKEPTPNVYKLNESASSSSTSTSSSPVSSASSTSSTPNNTQKYIEFDNDFGIHKNIMTTIPQQQQQHILLNGIIQPPQPPVPTVSNTFTVEIDDYIKKQIDEKLKGCESDSDLNLYTPKAVDVPSAQRLAKRLYYLDGFKVNDVVRHLCKKNDFSQLVADEYLKLFNFHGLTLDAALRKFLKQFQLLGDAQEKERVLMYFAKRYVDSNETTFNTVDTCHTLTCAIMLLNTDLHDPKIQNKMTLVEFIENLKGLNDGGNFSEALLESLYNAIKNDPLECASIDVEDIPFEERVGSLNGMSYYNNGANGIANGNIKLDCNPFLQLPDPQTAKEYRCGWLLRKCCIESDGKKAAFLKRSWKMFYASLRDMVLYLHKDDKGIKNNNFDNISNAIRIHHSYASVASDYKKKQFVFRLRTADWAEYLFQTSNTNELNEWVNVINLVAAMFSSPPLASPVGSSKTFQRPLLPVSSTRYTLQEQYDYHKKHVKQLQIDLYRLETIKDEKNFDKDKYNYIVFEIQRYTTYLKLLDDKLTETASTSMMNPDIIESNNVINTNISNNNNSLILTNLDMRTNTPNHDSKKNFNNYLN